ncbi:MAG: hypothetical protein DMF67_11040 [Acidobacteria bacterium]|nr:MAG: hypothetical protein DMF67_11040 [Acidobacteriota bacterium]
MASPTRPQPRVESSREYLLRLILRLIASAGREAQPAMFAHVHPHGHATARVAVHLASAVMPNVRKGTRPFHELAFGAHVHDIGKYLVRTEVLLKPDRLDEEEYALVAMHPVYGANILSNFAGMTDAIRRIVLHHHEHWDGTGYPEGLCGAAIPLEARVVAVADVYTSLRARRSYKATLRKPDACRELAGMAGRELDPQLVDDFIRLIGGEGA